MSFVHLHVHSHFSILDGFATPQEAASAAKGMGMEALAITDHGTMGGIVEHHFACKAVGIKPVIGCEIYITGDRFVQDKVRRADAGHLTLLAKDGEGYSNLLRISSLAELEGFYYKPRADMALVAENRAGIIVLSGCIKSELASLILGGDRDGAKSLVSRYRDLFGDDYYIEIQPNGLEEQLLYNRRALALASETNVAVVATNDVHYVTQEDSKAQDALLAIQSGKGKTLESQDRLKFGWDKFHLASEDQMVEMFGRYHPALDTLDVTTAIHNTGRIASRCDVDIEALPGTPPAPEIPGEYSGEADYLVALCSEGWKRRGGGPLPDGYMERLKYELETICNHGFAGYFFVIDDLMRYAREKGIACGPGRGSAAGSLAAYVLGITNVNPMEHGLMFERFINPDRFTPPDIDMDFQDDRRQEIKDYLSDKYGIDNVASIRVNSGFKAKNALRDTCRVMGVSPQEANEMAKFVDDDANRDLLDSFKVSPELVALDSRHPGLKNLSTGLQGRIRHRGMHASGIIVSAESLLGRVPLEKMRAAKTGIEQVTSAWDGGSLEKMGHLKIDALGSITVRVLEHTRQLVKERHGAEIDWGSLSLEEPAVLEQFAKGNTECVFQFMGRGITNLSVELGPSCFEDIVAINALIRPGPSRYSKDYVARKQGRVPVPDVHPVFDDITKHTFGFMIYQEQAMQLVNRLAGFSLAEADEVRSAMAKKKDKEMAKWEEKFLDGAGQTLGEAEAMRLWEILKEFSSYLFNKAHSTAYSYVGYYTMWCKVHYPLEFLTSMLNSVDEDEKVHRFIVEARRLGIRVLPPNINKSAVGFSVDGASIRAGLSNIKGVGEKAVAEILKERGRGFEGFQDFVLKTHGRCVKKDVIKALVGAGAFQTVYPRMDVMLNEFEYVLEQIKKDKQAAGQMRFGLVGVGHDYEEMMAGWKAP